MIGNKIKCSEILKNFDCSASSMDFKLAKAVLLDDFDTASMIMKRIGKGNDADVKKSDYRDWPLFKEFRNSKQFAMMYQEILEEKLDIVEKEQKDIQNIAKELEQVPYNDNPLEEAAATEEKK